VNSSTFGLEPIDVMVNPSTFWKQQKKVANSGRNVSKGQVEAVAHYDKLREIVNKNIIKRNFKLVLL
jgi:hypothetical protein